MHSSARRFLRAVIGFTAIPALTSCSSGDGGTPPNPPPGTPLNARVSSSGDQAITIAWDPASNATGYNLYLASQAGVNRSNYATKPDGERRTGVTSPATVTGLVNGRTYYLVVTATNTAGESGESSEVSATPQPPAPGAPANARLVTAGDQAVTFAWDAAPGATGYVLYLASQSGVNKTNYASRPDGQRRTGVTSPAAITGLVNGRTYYAVVTATNGGGESPESAEISGTPQPAFNATANAQLPGGAHAFSSFTVAAGVTVTIAAATVITVTGSVDIAGTVTADCQSVEIRATGSLVLNGVLRNTCSVPPAGTPPALKLVVDGELVIGSTVSAQDAILSSGSIRITDTATENVDLTPPPAFLAGSFSWTAPLVQAPPAATTANVSGNAAVNRPVRAGSGASVSTTRDGPLTVAGLVEAGNGADAPAKSEGPICDNANALGDNGGSVFLVARNNTLTFAAGATVRAGNGGKGGSCTATGCPVAQATAGRGGNGGGVYVGGQNLVFGAGVTLVRGNGGGGGDATATGNDGSAPCADGCSAVATASLGGNTGGAGYIITSPGSVSGAPSEGGANGGAGGVATARGGKGQDCDVCPAGKGGDGGSATATGGRGGNGATGNVWPVAAGTHLKGNGGNADAQGGQGGNGAECCEKFNDQPGGNGGKGGDATATGGQVGASGLGGNGTPGASTGKGGDGGDGGDGAPPGNGGPKGIGTGDPTDIPDGVDGAQGAPCPPLLIWFIYFSSIPDGPITPGLTIPLLTYAAAIASQPTGTVPVHFMTPQEFDGGFVQYAKSGNMMFMSRGGFTADLTGLLPGFPTFVVRTLLDVFCTTANCVQLVGYYQGQEKARVGVAAGGGSQSLELPPPDGTFPHYTSFALVGTGPFHFDHWWILIIDP